MPFLKKKPQGQTSNLHQSVSSFNSSPYYYSSSSTNNQTTQLNGVYRNNKVHNDVSSKFDDEMNNNSPCYAVEHLATFGYGPNFGLNCLMDGIKKLKQMELTHAIWAQRLILRLRRDAIVVEDENMEMVEAFPLQHVSEVLAHLSTDSASSRDLYNNLLVFVVSDTANKPLKASGQKSAISEMHIFQCVRISAEEVAEDVRQYIKGKFSFVPCGKRENNTFESGRVSQLPPFPYYDHSPPPPIFPGGGSSTANSAAAAARLSAPSSNGHAAPVVVPLPLLSNGRPSPSSNGGGGSAERQSNRNYYVDQQRQTTRQSSSSNGFQTPTNFERDVNTLNRSFDDVERFVARIHQAAVLQREIEASTLAAMRKNGTLGVRRLNNNNSPYSTSNNNNGLPSAAAAYRSRQNQPSTATTPPAFFPSETDFVEIFQKFKLCFNLLAKLKNHIHEPNAPELVHFLFTPFALILDACTWGMGRHLVSQIFNPALTAEAKILLDNSLNSREKEMWISLGDAWTVPDYSSPSTIIKNSPDLVDYAAQSRENVGRIQYSPLNGKMNDVDQQVINDKLKRLALEEDRITREKQELARKEMALKHKEMILLNREENLHREMESSSRTTPEHTSTMTNGHSNGFSNGHSSTMNNNNNNVIMTKAEVYKENGSNGISKPSSSQTPPNGDLTTNNHNQQQTNFLTRLLAKSRLQPVKIAQATYDRTGQNEKELSVQKFEYVEILNDTKKWWECKNCQNVCGYVPHTILKILNEFDMQHLQKKFRDGQSSSTVANGNKINGHSSADNTSYPDYLQSKIGSKGEFRYF